MLIKMTVWYVVALILWFFMFGFVMAVSSLRTEILVNYTTLNIGLLIGLIFRDHFFKRPWLFIFVPILYICAGLFGF